MTTQDGAGQELRISADSHVSEPPDLWRTRLPARFRDLDQVGRLTERIRLGRGTHYRAGGWDVDERLRDMAADGVAAEVLYPTVANAIYRLVEPGAAGHELAEACSQAYNDWMIEYCGEAPDRLWGLAHLSLWDVDAAVRELERCKRAGLVGATIWVVPPEDLPFTSLHYERFWDAAEQLRMPIGMHVNAGFTERIEPAASDPEQRLRRLSYGHKLVAMQTMTDFIISGVLERHPDLRLVLAEFDVGWIPFWLEDLDRKSSRNTNIDGDALDLPLHASEYFSRQVYGTFMQDGVGGYLLQRWGADNFLWGNDYPHPGGVWPFSDDTIELTLGHLDERTRAKVVSGNTAELYGMPAPAPMPRLDPPDMAEVETYWDRPWLKRAGAYTFDKPVMGLTD